MKPLDAFYPNVPEKAFVVLDSHPIGVGCVTRGFKGYSLVYDYTPKPGDSLTREAAIACARKCVDRYNEALGVTKGQAMACHIGSLAGWSVPGANPVRWTHDGMPIDKQ